MRIVHTGLYVQSVEHFFVSVTFWKISEDLSNFFSTREVGFMYFLKFLLSLSQDNFHKNQIYVEGLKAQKLIFLHCVANVANNSLITDEGNLLFKFRICSKDVPS